MQILKVEAVVTPLEDTIVQPFTGRVVRQILFKVAEKVEARELLEFLSSSAPRKPYSITPLYRGGVPVFRTPSDSKPLCLRKGLEYGFRACFVVRSLDIIKVLYGFLEDVEIYGSKRVSVRITGTEILDETALGIPLRPKETITLCFETPTLLQLPKLRKKSKINRYLLYPLPSLMIYSLKENWNAYADWKIKMASWRANYAFVAVDHRIFPVTTIYDKERKPRGFIGYATYQIMTKSSKILEALSKLLHYATLTNIGKSRSIGYGVVSVTKLSQISKCRKILEKYVKTPY